MVLETIEVVTLIISVVALILISKVYGRNKDISGGNVLWKYILLSAVFLVANRVFTNMEGLYYREFFNFLEHLTTALLAFFLLMSARFTRGYNNGS
ncbi:hypothetical protein HN747_00590 [archaeon]|jgi:hypothetical protein|nr:hypothetical protein [archaeon]